MANEKVIRSGLRILGTLGSGAGDPLLTIDSTTKDVGSISSIDLSAYLGNSLTSSRIFVGNGSNIATGVAVTGAITITNTGVTSLTPEIITNTEVSSVAAIAYSKLNLAGGIVNGDIASNAAITRIKVATGNIYRILVNNNLGEFSEASAITANRLIISDANGLPSASGITNTVAGYLDPTSSVQTQLNNKLAFSSAITPVNGDLLYYSGGAWTNLAIGTSGQILTVSGGGLPSWAANALTGALPTGGTDNQYLKKIDATNYNATWDTLALSDLSDVTANITQVNALATGYYDATSSVQTQLNGKLSTSLTTDNILKGVGGVATATTDLPTGITIGSQYIYRTGGTDVTLADGGTGASLTDPGADRILFWDDSATQVTWLEAGSGLTITGTTISTSGGVISGLTANRIPYATSATAIADDSALTWDAVNNILTVGASRFFSSTGKTIEDIFIGNAAGNTTGTGSGGNIGIGIQSLSAITTASQNTVVGGGAGLSLTTGGANALLGFQTGALTTSGSKNIFVGNTAGGTNTSGSSNVVVGANINLPSATADGQLSIQNIIFGTGNTGEGTTVSSGNIGIAVANPTARLHLPAGTATVSTSPLKLTTGTALTTPEDGAIEYHSSHLYFTIGSTRYQLDQQGVLGLTTNRIPYATSTTTLGDDSALTWDSVNNALTIGVARIHSTGTENMFIGESAGNFTLTGTRNTALGYTTLDDVTTGTDNTAIGYQALRNSVTTAIGNTAIGASTLNTSVGQLIGNYNTAIGYSTKGDPNAFSGAENVLVGAVVGSNLSSANGNIIVGYSAGSNITTGDNNIIIGYDIDAPSATDNNQLSIQNIIFGTSNSGTGTTVSTGSVGVGTPSPDRRFHVELDSAATNTVTYVQRLTSTSSGTPASGIGVGLEFEVETSASNNEVGAIVEAVTTDVASTSEDFKIVFKTMAAGAAAAQRLSIDSVGTSIYTTTGGVTINESDTGTNNIITGLRIERSTSGTVAAGFGIQQAVALENDAGTIVNHSYWNYTWSNPASGDTDAKIELNTYTDGVAETALTINRSALEVNKPLKLKSYTVAGVPTASDYTGSMIYVSNETGGAIPAFSDGTDWRRVTDRAIIS